MGALYENIIRRVLFTQDAEHAHDRAVAWLALLGRVSPLTRLMEAYNRPARGEPTKLFGLSFPNPVGLAAGFDKNAVCWNAVSALGFGFVEIGTVTLHDQPGNPRPRITRYPEQEALINRMGFPNDGAEAIAARLARGPGRKKRRVPLGINIGKSKVTPLDHAIDDYLGSFNLLADYADYLVVNISSPNTPGLRRLQNSRHLGRLLEALAKADSERSRKLGKPKVPMLVKIAPDLTFRQIDDVLELVQANGFAGVVATNTTIERPAGFEQVTESGGLSGRPLHTRAVEVVNYINRACSGELPIIGVGGIMDEKSAGQMFDAGASLIQLYTGLVYQGPFLAKRVARALSWQSSEWV